MVYGLSVLLCSFKLLQTVTVRVRVGLGYTYLGSIRVHVGRLIVYAKGW